MNYRTFRDRISIEKKVAVVDPRYGAQAAGWQLVADRIPAEVQDFLPSRSTETVKLGAAMASRLARIRFRLRTDLDSTMRVTVHALGGDRVMEIVGGPAVVGNRDATEIVCADYSTIGAGA